MLTLAKAIAILAYTGAVAATPVPDANTPFKIAGASFTLESREVHGAPMHQLEHIVDIKRRAGVEVHPKLAEAANQFAAKRHATLAARQATGTLYGKSPDPWDTSFIYPVQIAGKTFRLFGTTAASDLWVYSSAIPKNQTVGHTVYDLNPAHMKPGNFSIGYDGVNSQAFGNLYVEPITVGGITAKTTFGAATQAVEDFTNDKTVDGRFGLGPMEYNFLGETIGSIKTWFREALPQLAKPVFAVAHTKGHGVFDFGFINQKKISGPITWVDNFLEDYWEAYCFYAQGWAVGDQNAKTSARKMKIHLNSGTDVSFTDPDVVKAWYSRIPGAVTQDDQGYTIPCNSKPPGWTVVIGGRKFYTPGCQLISQPVDDDGKVCLGGLQNIGGGVDFHLFGTNFFKGKYVIHDFTNPNKVKLGFALQPGSK
ncbi:aspartic peptidase domain-containing protein [Bipolaris maydis]|nr:aspartic peptidase domain-containing protein [Bipolaris maydis]KAJ6192496.1 aspartic peptidase domain-containing protein [Bipolaris maydis]